MKYKTQKPPLNIIKHIDSFKGVNTADNIYSVKENQLSDAINLWCPNGALKNRPGLALNNSVLKSYDRGYDYLKTCERFLPPFKAGSYCKIGAVTEVRVSGYISVFYYLWDKNGNKKILEEIPFVSATGRNVPKITNVAFVFGDKIEGSGIFTIITLKEYFEDTVNKKIIYYELDADFEKWILIDNKKFYTPVIFRYGKGNNYSSVLKQGTYKGKDPEMLEGINLLNGAFSMYFSCDGASDTFNFPLKKVSLGDVVRIDYAISILDTKSVSFSSNENYREIDLFGQTIGIELDRVNGKISFKSNGLPFAYPKVKEENTIKVTAYKYDNDKAYELFSNNVDETYFDGRLLRAGSENSCNKLFYSGKDNHFYFCESAHIPVGEKSYSLTAAAYQNRYLFLFKENEIYRLRLEESSYYDINEIIEKDLKFDVKPISYTLMAVNSAVGCDCPKSIAFCTNRLVWYHSDGFVYCLYGTNSYTEGSVYVLSDDIADQLKVKTDDKSNVIATSYQGYYFLCINDKIFVMDTLVSGFRYLSGMKNSVSSNGGLNWFIWQLPENVWLYSIYTVASKLYALVGSLGDKYYGSMYIAAFSEEKNTDTVMADYDISKEKPISTSFSTAVINPDKSRNALLKKISIDMENKNVATANIFTRTLKGKQFLITPQTEGVKKLFYIPPFLCSGAGISLKCDAPITINALDFEFDLKG